MIPISLSTRPSHEAPVDLAGPGARSVWRAMRRGAARRCPACGAGRLYRAYLKVADHCPRCGEALHHQRADDAPPYVTIFLVGHLVLPVVLMIDMAYEWPMWLNALVWLPLTAALAMALLPLVKGALVGLQWALRMHGFGNEADDTDVIAPGVAREPAT